MSLENERQTRRTRIDHKLDIIWLKDESLECADELPEPQDLAAESITELEAAVGDLREIAAMLEASVS